jgi:membrane protein DedA with SNARE-associated domain
VPDITAPLVNFATDQVGSYGVLAVFLLMILESACIPVPSEAIMLYGGFLVSRGDESLPLMVAAGVAGNILGSWLAYGAGRYKGREWVLRWHWLHVTPRRLDSADHWFQRYGSWAVLVSRCLPIIRTFISLPAGIARMPFWRFTLYTAIGCVPWVLALTLIGVWVGSKWDEWHKRLEVLDYLVAAGIVAAIVYLVLRRRRGSAHA